MTTSDNWSAVTPSRHTASTFKIFIGAAIVFALSWTYFGSAVFNRPFHTRGEGREAIVVRAMVTEPNYVLPLRNGNDIPSKPPMFHWTAAGFAQAFGELNEAAIRMPSALYSALGLGVFFAFVATELGLGAAALATVMLATTFEWLRSSTHARVDMTFSFWLIATLISLFQSVHTSAEKKGVRWAWFVLSGLCCTASILAKGPAGALLPLAIIGLYVLFTARRPLLPSLSRFPFIPAVTVLTLSVAGAAIWYYLAYLRQGERFLHVQLFQENLTRVMEVDGEERGHHKPFFMVPVLFVQAYMPWSLVLLPTIVWLWQSWSEAKKDPRIIFCLTWLGVFIGVVMLSLSKRMVYLLPAYPAATYLLFRSMLSLGSNLSVGYQRAVKITGYAILAVGIAAILGVGAMTYLGISDLDALPLGLVTRLHRAPELPETAAIFGKNALLIVGGALGAVSTLASGILFIRNRPQAPLTFAIAILLGSAVMNYGFLPEFARLNTAKEFMAEIRPLVPADKPLYQFEHQFYPAIYYSGRNLPELTADEAKALNEAYVLVREDDLALAQQSLPRMQTLATSSTKAADGRGKLVLVYNPA